MPHTHVPRTQRRGQNLLFDQINAEHNNPGGDATIAKPTRMQKNQTHGITESIRPFPSHCSSPRHLFVVLFESDLDPGKEHMPTQTSGWVFDAKPRNGKGTPGRAASPPTTMPDPPPSMQCTHHTSFVGRRLRPGPPTSVGSVLIGISAAECFVPRRISTSFYVGWPASACWVRRESQNAPTCLRPTRRTKTKSTRLKCPTCTQRRMCTPPQMVPASQRPTTFLPFLLAPPSNQAAFYAI